MVVEKRYQSLSVRRTAILKKSGKRYCRPLLELDCIPCGMELSFLRQMKVVGAN